MEIAFKILAARWGQGLRKRGWISQVPGRSEPRSAGNALPSAICVLEDASTSAIQRPLELGQIRTKELQEWALWSCTWGVAGQGGSHKKP